MHNGLPLEVLGLMSPLLCWVESVERMGLPEPWLAETLSFKLRERAWLMRELPTYSFDNLDEIIQSGRDRRRSLSSVWPSSGPKRKSSSGLTPPADFDLMYTFQKLSNHYFQWLGNTVAVRKGLMVEIHELAVRFPVRHIIRFCHAAAVARGYITQERALELPEDLSRLHSTYQSLRTVLDQGLHEGHMHLNSVITPDEAWADHLFNRISSGTLMGFKRRDDRLVVLGRTAIKLLAMGIVTYHLDRNGKALPFDLIHGLDRMYLASDHFTGVEARLFLDKRVEEATLKLQKKIRQEGANLNYSDLSWLLALINPIMLAANKKDRPENPHPKGRPSIRGHIRLMEKIHFETQKILVSLDDHPDLSPVPPRIRLSSKVPLRSPIRSDNSLRKFLHQVFYRYILYHTHHWRHATQSGKTTGLRYFRTFFYSKQRQTHDWTESRGLAFDRLVEDTSVNCVEGRLSPPRNINDVNPWIMAYIKNRKLKNVDKFGIVIHFIKEDHVIAQKRRRNRGIPKLRYGRIRRKTRREAFRLFRLLSRPNPVMPFIVGIDAANLELTTPPEVFAPSFRFLQEFPIEIRQSQSASQNFGALKNFYNLFKNRRLGMTYHVGEDFRHILSGLRAIDEVLEFLKPHPGDRLGHAIALAIEPITWASQIGFQAVLPKLEWLDTLVWVHHLLGPGNDLIGQLAVEDQIQKYSRDIYGNCVYRDTSQKSHKNSWVQDWSPPTLYDAWRLRQLDPYCVDLDNLVENRFHFRKRVSQRFEFKRWYDVQEKVWGEIDQYIGSDSAYRFLGFYWFSHDVRKIGDEIITVDMHQTKNLWMEVFRQAQEKMRNRVQNCQLVVEVNPTSNRLIGPLASLEDHHIFSLTLDQNYHLRRDIRVTVNTDNPGVLSTSLTHEYYMLGEILIGRGVPEAQVVEWLNWLRTNGEDFSFLRNLPKTNNRFYEVILNNLWNRHQCLLDQLSGTRPSFQRYLRAKKLHGELISSNYLENLAKLDQDINR